MSRQLRRQPHADRGASLVLVMCFVVMIGALCAGLITLATSALNNHLTLRQTRDRQYAADGAIEQAISQVRRLTCATTTESYLVDASLNGVAIRVDWVNTCGVVQSALDGSIVGQRNVIFSACLNAADQCDDAKVLARAEVNFQGPIDGSVTKTFVQSWNVNR